MKLERELESVKCACSVMNTSEWKFKDIKVSVIGTVPCLIHQWIIVNYPCE